MDNPYTGLLQCRNLYNFLNRRIHSIRCGTFKQKIGIRLVHLYLELTERTTYHLYDADPIDIQADLHLTHDKHFDMNATLQLAYAKRTSGLLITI